MCHHNVGMHLQQYGHDGLVEVLPGGQTRQVGFVLLAALLGLAPAPAPLPLLQRPLDPLARPQLRPRPQPARGDGGHPPAAAAGVAAGPGLQLLSQLVTAALQHTGSLKHSHNVMFDLIS